MIGVMRVPGQSHRTNIYVGLGSNLGEREENLEHAISAIETAGLQVLGVSSVYETEPVDYREQPWFLNQVARLGSTGYQTAGYRGAQELLDCLLEIEKMMGRQRLFRAGPRIIDLDLLLYGDLIVGHHQSQGGPANRAAIDRGIMAGEAEIDLVVPHPRLHLRRFVLVPLSELAAALVHPVLGKTIAELLATLTDKSNVKLYRG